MAHDASDGPNYNTTYFSLDLVRDAVTGCCHDFALALHRRTRWPVAVLWKDPIVDRFTLFRGPSLVHAFCIAPDGQAVDVEGAQAVEALRQVYESQFDLARVTFRLEVYPTETAYAAAIDAVPAMHSLAPREVGIAAVEKVLQQSPAFLGLVESLRAGPPMSGRPTGAGAAGLTSEPLRRRIGR